MRTASSITELLEGNRRWRDGVLQQDPGAFQALSKSHKPKYMWIGCCDARVPVDRLIDVPQGELFVARNVANLVCDMDVNIQAAIQYAVDVLLVEHIIVCGHYDCGGVRAAVENRDHGSPLENWLGNIRDVHRLHELELLRFSDAELRHRRLVELNVLEQCLHVFKTGVVQRRHARTSQWKSGFTMPRIHALVYDVSDGLIRELPLPFEADRQKFSNIYQMYFSEEEPEKEAQEAQPSTGGGAVEPAGRVGGRSLL